MSKICCFTGHRDIDVRSYRDISAKLETLLIELIENEDFSNFRAGGARGFDSIAASTVLKLKKRYPHIKLHLLLPCKGQDKYFTLFEKRIYDFATQRADTISYVQNHYTKDSMFTRNRALVDGADLCIAYLERLAGGTSYTVNYARKKQVKTINLLKL